MTSADLRARLVEALKKLGSNSEPVEAFRAALMYRRKQSDFAESAPDPQGLRWALERALSLYSGRSAPVPGLRREVADNAFLESLAQSAEQVPDSVYVRLLRRLENEGMVRADTVDAVMVMSGALLEYANYADEGLTSGP